MELLSICGPVLGRAQQPAARLKRKGLLAAAGVSMAGSLTTGEEQRSTERRLKSDVEQEGAGGLSSTAEPLDLLTGWSLGPEDPA